MSSAKPFKRLLFPVVAAAAMVLSVPTAAAQTELPVWPAVKIWDSDCYCAFTDLTRFNDRFYCAFREGSAHVHGENGKIRVIASDDGDTWRSVALLAEDGVDLRDPKLSVTPDGKLMINMGGSFYEDRRRLKCESRVAFSDGRGEEFSPPRPVRINPAIRSDFDWLWRVTWHGDTAYGVLYQPNRPGNESAVHLVSSRDGVSYELVHSFALSGRPNEATLRFMPDGELVALLRREAGNRSGCVGVSRPPYTEWKWHEIGHRLGGPNFVRLPDGRLIAGTRAWETTPDGKAATFTILALLTQDGGFEPVLRLESGGDTSYPGLLMHDGELWVSYYSSHEGHAAIYLAKIPLAKLKPAAR
jgi:hypothetical protein